jgi:hypothetical protein
VHYWEILRGISLGALKKKFRCSYRGILGSGPPTGRSKVEVRRIPDDELSL